jgi:anti-sigma-K factor RskA
MNTQEYITSGILEDYALGLLGPQETREVECLSSIYPEIQEHLRQLEGALDRYAQAKAIEPKPETRSKILAAIDQLPPKAQQNETLIVPLVPAEAKIRSIRPYQWAAAASAILAVACLALYFSTRQTQQETLAQLEQIKSEKEQLDNNYQIVSSGTRVELKGLEAKDPTALVTLYWNKKSQAVSIEVNQLPATAADKQYQLWALVDGNPVDLGVFDLVNGLQAMKNIPNAQAFAITLEKKGGSPTPTLSEMYVLGNV